MNSTQYDIAICILFHEKLDQTIECLTSILSTANVNIYILNNGSSQSSRQMLAEFTKCHAKIKIFDSNINLGVSGGRNFLISNTNEQWLFFIDSDITIKSPDWLNILLDFISNYNDIDAFIPRLYNLHDDIMLTGHNIFIENNKFVFKKSTNNLSNYFPGGASIVNRSVFDRLGYYDDKMFIGFEDYELALRGIITEKPIKAMHINEVLLVHDHRPAITDEDKNAAKVRYDCEIIENSFQRITEKYNISLIDDWRPWVNTQKEMMLQPENKINPSACTLFLTDRCNFKCAGCSRAQIGVKNFQEMKLDVVQKLLITYPSITEFCIAGLGEPTLCSNLKDIVHYLKENGKQVGIITNGFNIEPLLTLNYAPESISISLYGFDNITYKAYCGVDGFETVIENYYKLKTRFHNVGFSYIVNKYNYQTLEKIIPLCDKLQPNFLNIVNYLVYNSESKTDQDMIITTKDTEIIDFINQICNMKNYIKIKPFYVNFDSDEFHCKSYYRLINLDGDGNIGGCRRNIPPNRYFGNIFLHSNPYCTEQMENVRKRIQHGCFPHKECQWCFGRFILEK